MDPLAISGSCWRLRFPRPRGDGPCEVARRSELSSVSPPTRGWTSSWSANMEPSPGFPAHAGMDPRADARRHRAFRFPRPRGDGPCHGLVNCEMLTVSPPTRGWTRLLRRLSSGGLGFPAHAGMDRRRSRRIRPRPGFPRPRGDGPFQEWLDANPNLVSPPTRGWTAVQVPVAGFPAHAGMDPRGTTKPAWKRRFPRPRGDGPPPSPTRWDRAQVSPPTRGWTARRPSATD